MSELKSLKSCIEVLCVELENAAEAAAKSEGRVKLITQKISMTLQVAFDSSMKAGGGVAIFSGNVNAEASQGNSKTHSVTLDFKPVFDITPPPNFEKSGNPTIDKLTPKPRLTGEQKKLFGRLILGGPELSRTEMKNLVEKIGIENVVDALYTRQLLVNSTSKTANQVYVAAVGKKHFFSKMPIGDLKVRTKSDVKNPKSSS